MSNSMSPADSQQGNDPAPAPIAAAPTPVSPPVLPGHKEQAPIPQFSEQAIGMTHEQIEEADHVAKQENDSYWEAHSRELELEKEVEDLGGVEKIDRGEVPVPKELAKEMGIEPTVTIDTPMVDATGFSVSGTSLTDDQLTTGLKKPTSSGFRWLSEWFVYELLKAHYHLKRIGGKIVRQKEG